MNKYLLFTFDSYYPSGGMNDCELKFQVMTNEISDKYLSDKYFYIPDKLQVYDIENDYTDELNINEYCSKSELDRYGDEEKLLEIIKGWLLKFQ